MQTDFVVPYTPSGSEFFKYKLVMDTLIPGSSYLFPNERFTPIERVSQWKRIPTLVIRILRNHITRLQIYHIFGTYNACSLCHHWLLRAVEVASHNSLSLSLYSARSTGCSAPPWTSGNAVTSPWPAAASQTMSRDSPTSDLALVGKPNLTRSPWQTPSSRPGPGSLMATGMSQHSLIWTGTTSSLVWGEWDSLLTRDLLLTATSEYWRIFVFTTLGITIPCS